ncbi:MAG: PDZ domain-containing protein [Anaerolineae bacterium]|nr:PDZ domain-containing protein [Anaerolineae bacterium]
MEERSSNRVVWIVLGIIVGILLICAISATAGGLAGYWAGRKAAMASQRLDEETPFEFRIEPWRLQPSPESPLPPDWMPRMPDLEPFAGERLGALVITVMEDSPAERAGLRVGDVIVELDGHSFEEEGDLADVLAEYEPGDMVELTVLGRGEGERVVEAELGRHPERGGESAYLGVSYRMVSAEIFERGFTLPGR